MSESGSGRCNILIVFYFMSFYMEAIYVKNNIQKTWQFMGKIKSIAKFLSEHPLGIFF